MGIQNLSIDGTAKISGGEYGTVRVDGIATCEGDLKADSLSIDGILRCRGALAAGTLECDGLATVRGNVSAKSIEVDGLMKVTEGSRIEAEEIGCDGVIKVSGEITADRIVADGFVNAREITGDSIVIRSRRNVFQGLFRSYRSHIELIEATTVDLRSVVAREVNGRDVRIGRGCRIDRVDCSGTLFVSPGARVGKITGEYVMGED